jgi:hypothetical protein
MVWRKRIWRTVPAGTVCCGDGAGGSVSEVWQGEERARQKSTNTATEAFMRVSRAIGI